VRRCLGALTPLQAESVTLAYYGGYTYPQVAQLLGISLGTAKTRIRDGRSSPRPTRDLNRCGQPWAAR
jgi:RNA polymerase sigma-70 factor (ECF subfamily)